MSNPEGEGTTSEWPSDSSNYELLEEVGAGGSASVYRAVNRKGDRPCAAKVVDLEKGNVSVDVLRKEILTLGMTSHPNVVKYHISFVDDNKLWIVMDYMDCGSILDIMTYQGRGLEEPIIATVLQETLNAIAYFHKTGRIHRDIKSGNILVNSQGDVKLADLGVSAWLLEDGEQKVRNTLVGTPCWMAPEIVQGSGHTYSADIWSFGITAIELAQGVPPHANHQQNKTMLLVLQNPPPTLDERFGRALRDMVACCLQKEPTARPTAEKLRTHKFFGKAKKPEYIVKNLLAQLPPLSERFQLMKNKRKAKAIEELGGLGKSSKLEASEKQAAKKPVKMQQAWDFGDDDAGDGKGSEKAAEKGGETKAAEPKKPSSKSNTASAPLESSGSVTQKGRFKVHKQADAVGDDGAASMGVSARRKKSTKTVSPDPKADREAATDADAEKQRKARTVDSGEIARQREAETTIGRFKVTKKAE